MPDGYDAPVSYAATCPECVNPLVSNDGKWWCPGCEGFLEDEELTGLPDADIPVKVEVEDVEGL